MNYELSPALKKKADLFLETKSEFIGPRYGRSGVKRALDILVSSAGSPLALSVMGMAGLAIWLDDEHWPFVDAGTDGILGEHVSVWKLRTMVPQAIKHEVEITKGLSMQEFKRAGIEDPRITRFGKLLRKTSLDETPQIFNVMLGSLSLVGARYFSKSDLNAIYTRNDTEPYRGFIELLHNGLKFGVTGFYAVMGRDQLGDDERCALEVLYWERQSFASDLRIIAATLPALFQNNGK